METGPAPIPYDPRWTTDGPNILAEENLERIWQALTDGWIGGIHLYCGGGRSGDSVAFCTFDAFLSHVTASRPGDLFNLWSVAEVRRKGLLLVDSHFKDTDGAGRSLLSPGDLDRVREYLSEAESNEVLSISSAGGGELEAIWTDLEGSGWNPFLNAARHAAVPGGALCVLPLTKVDCPEFHLVKAKRPNDQGQVPLGGAY